MRKVDLMAEVLDIETGPNSALTGPVINNQQPDVSRYQRTGQMLEARLPYMVKGAGYAQGGNMPLSDPVQISTKAHQAALDLRTETYRGYTNRASVVKGLNENFLNQFGNLKTALTAPSIGDQLAQVIGGMPGGSDALKSFTAGNLGIGSIYGLVPFDLLAPSRLIYPMYTVFRK